MSIRLALEWEGWQPRTATLRMPKRLRWPYVVAALLAAFIMTAGAADGWLRTTTRASMPADPGPSRLFVDPVAMPITISGSYARATRSARPRDSSPKSGQSTSKIPLLRSTWVRRGIGQT